MKVLLINGSPNAKGCTYTALSEVASSLEKEKIETEILHIGKQPIRGCIACYGCRKESLSSCVFTDDVVNELINKIKQVDALILASSVYYAGIAGQMKSLLDRVFFAGGKSFENKLGAAVVSARRGGASATFDQLNHYFSVSNMHIVSSQYWNQVHGMTPDDVKKDLEGLQTMRSLAQNMSWLLKCIESGKLHGVEKPSYEERVRTNFI